MSLHSCISISFVWSLYTVQSSFMVPAYRYPAYMPIYDFITSPKVVVIKTIISGTNTFVVIKYIEQ